MLGSSPAIQEMKSNTIKSFATKKESMLSFYLVLFYLFLEYGRPQTFLTFLSPLHLPALTIVFLGLSLFVSGRFKLDDMQTKLYLLFLVIMIIHGPIAVNNYWALMTFIAMAMNFIVFLSLIHHVDSTEKYRKLIKIWMCIHIFLAVMGIIKKGRGIGGFLGDENDFCMTLNMIIPFSFFLAFNSPGIKKIYYILLTCLFLIVIILTQSRGGFVGLCATGTYCLIRTKKKALMATLAGLLALFAVLVAPSSYWNEVRSISEEGTKRGTGEERIYTWGIGWHMFLDNPFLGVGQGNFPWVFKKYELEVAGEDEPFHGRSVAGRAAHSIYFTLLPELGIIGTFLFFAMILHDLKDINKIKKLSFNRYNSKVDNRMQEFYFIALALEGSLVSYLASGAFISILYYPNLWILMGFIVSLKNIYYAKINTVPASSLAR